MATVGLRLARNALPEQTVIFRIVQDHLETLYAAASASSSSSPSTSTLDGRPERMGR